MSRRRKVGVAAFKKTNKEEFKRKGEELSAQEIEKLEQQLQIFREKLETFAKKHKKDINRDPALRAHFQSMCSSIGVDPLASNKGFWAEVLGVGDFYYELGVQAIEICLNTREANGGLMPVADMVMELQARRPHQKIAAYDFEPCIAHLSCQRIMFNAPSGGIFNVVSYAQIRDDVERAVKQLKVLGSGFGLVKIGKEKFIRSVPVELSTDHIAVLALAENTGFVTRSMMRSELGWEKPRIDSVLHVLMNESISWIDEQHPEECAYWFASMRHMDGSS